MSGILLAAVLLLSDGDRYGDVTAYSLCCTTASGTHVRPGVAACPPDIAFGTSILIDQVGTVVCEDRGGAIGGDNIDLWVPTYQEAITFGRRTLHWRVSTPTPGE